MTGHLENLLGQQHQLCGFVNAAIRKAYPVGTVVRFERDGRMVRGRVIGYEHRWRLDLKVETADGIVTKVVSLNSPIVTIS